MENTTIKRLYAKYNFDEIIEYYSNHSASQTIEKFNTSLYHLNMILQFRDIPKHTKSENTRFTCIEKYGVDNVSKSSEAKEKIKSSKLQRYGDSNYNNSDKIKTTCLEKYGMPSASGSSEIKAKVKQTYIDNYGVDNIFKDVEYLNECRISKYGSLDGYYKYQQERREKTFIAKYGVDNPSKIPGNRYKALTSMVNTCRERYGVDFPTLLPQCQFSKGFSANSSPNISFSNLLKSYNIEHSAEFTLQRRSYDFIISGTNILIEINPYITHNSTYSPFGEKEVKGKTYHYDKSLLATSNGYRCICVWDWDDEEKIIQLLLPKSKIYARECSIKNVSIEESKQFINNYHLQGYTKSDINIGLYYNNNLVSIMTFGKPRYNKNYEYELIRYCPCMNVTGGSERLFTYFLRTYNPKSIVSYCDLSKFSGSTYSKLKFTLKNVSIGKHWYNPKTKQHITNNLLLSRGFDQLFGTNFGKGTSNEQLMLEHEFVEIYDCGQATYVYINDYSGSIQ